MKIKNVMGNEYSGTIGNKVVAASWKGIEYIRGFRIPQNPKTPLQMEQRTYFTAAVGSWHTLTQEQRDAYELMAVRMTGFNLYVKRFLEALRNSTPMPPPQSLTVEVFDNESYRLADVVVKYYRGSKFIREIRTDSLGRASLALTLEDAPYIVEVVAQGYGTQRMTDLRPGISTVTATITPIPVVPA
jgi:hypothetical protein